MKKYTKYFALCAVIAMGSYTNADAGIMDGINSLKHRAMNSLDKCNAGAGGSGKALQVAEECIGDNGTKNRNFSVAYWKAHCNYGNPGGDGDYGSDETGMTDGLCFAARAALNVPDEFTGCNDASEEAAIADGADPKIAAAVVKYCIDDTRELGKAKEGDNQDADELAAATAWHGANCTPDDNGKVPAKNAKKCKAVEKVIPSLVAAG